MEGRETDVGIYEKYKMLLGIFTLVCGLFGHRRAVSLLLRGKDNLAESVE
jgi:hypothetical protein